MSHSGSLWIIILNLLPGIVKAGSMLPFSKETFPDPVVNYTLCGRPAPSWVCDPGGYLTQQQGDTLDSIIRELNDINNPSTVNPTIMVAVVPRIVLSNGAPTDLTSDVIRFTDHLQSVSWRRHSTRLVVALYRVSNHTMAVQPGITSVSGECICQVYYESRQYFNTGSFYTLLDISVRIFRDVILGRQYCATSSDNVPWQKNANGLCTWTTEILISGMTPITGPPEGGTRLVITGHNLDMAQGVRIGAQGCTVIQRNGTSITCMTHGTSTEVNTPVPVYLMLDGAVRYDTGRRYVYTQLTITTVRPLTTTVSGGLLLTVEGTSLDLVQSAVLMTTLTSRQTRRRSIYHTNCTVKSPTYMLCPTPKLDLDSVRTVQTRRDVTDILKHHTKHKQGLTIDTALTENTHYQHGPAIYITDVPIQSKKQHKGHTIRGNPTNFLTKSTKHQRGHTTDKGVTNLFEQNTKDREARSTHEEDSVKVEDVDVDCEIVVNGNPMMPRDLERDSFRLIMYQDPNLYPFEGQDQMLIFHSMWPKNDRFIDIKGSQLLPAMRDHELLVMIGPMKCDDMEIFSNQLTCSPPVTKPEMQEDFPPVLVKLGNLEFSIGYLNYIDNVWDYPPFRYAIIGGGVGFGLILIVVILCCCYCKRKPPPKKNSKQRQHAEIRIPPKY